MEATRCLREEHRVILGVLDCFEIALREAHAAGSVTRDAFGPFLEFFRGFADRCHHCKEEARLFPRLESKGVPREGGPIGVMLHEHEQGRTHVRAMADRLEAAEGGDAEAARMLLEHGGAFLEMLRAHIQKEDGCLFGMADALIQGDDRTALLTAYREAEDEGDYDDTITRCRAIADRLRQRYGVAAS